VVAKESEYASSPRDDGSQPVLAPIVFEDRDLAALPANSRPIDATRGLSEEVLETLRVRVAKAVHVLPLGNDDPFRFKYKESKEPAHALGDSRHTFKANFDETILNMMSKQPPLSSQEEGKTDAWMQLREVSKIGLLYLAA
jgi:hypothetical protein